MAKLFRISWMRASSSWSWRPLSRLHQWFHGHVQTLPHLPRPLQSLLDSMQHQSSLLPTGWRQDRPFCRYRALRRSDKVTALNLRAIVKTFCIVAETAGLSCSSSSFCKAFVRIRSLSALEWSVAPCFFLFLGRVSAGHVLWSVAPWAAPYCVDSASPG